MALAALGKREADAEGATPGDEFTSAELEAVRRQATRVWVKSVAVGVALTAVAVVIS